MELVRDSSHPSPSFFPTPTTITTSAKSLKCFSSITGLLPTWGLLSFMGHCNDFLIVPLALTYSLLHMDRLYGGLTTWAKSGSLDSFWTSHFRNGMGEGQRYRQIYKLSKTGGVVGHGFSYLLVPAFSFCNVNLFSLWYENKISFKNDVLVTSTPLIR